MSPPDDNVKENLVKMFMQLTELEEDPSRRYIFSTLYFDET